MGQTRTGETITQDDINVLQVLSNQAALAIENAIFWQQEEAKIITYSREQTASDISFGAGHQFNNRLYAISLTAETVVTIVGKKDIERMSAEELRSHLKKAIAKFKKISDECRFGAQITAGIMSLTGASPKNFTEFDIIPIIQSSLEMAKMKHSKDKIEENKPPVLLVSHVPQELPQVFGSDAQIRDCLFNIIDNSFDAVYERYSRLPEHESYIPQIEICAFVKDGYVVITIADNGIGIEEENKQKIFMGYFTTKPTSVKGYGAGGHGIGLYTVHNLILAHKGRISFTSELGKGTVFTIELPISSKEAGCLNY